MQLLVVLEAVFKSDIRKWNRLNLHGHIEAAAISAPQTTTMASI